MIFFMVALLGAVGAYILFFCRPLSKTDADIKKLLDRLTVDMSGDDEFYVEHFEDIDRECAKYESVKPVWSDFKKSLTRHKDFDSEKIYSSTGAVDYFSFHNFTRGLNLSFWNGYGGTFTGLGILGTFFGLTVGLNGIDMTSSDVEILKSGIASLLSGVQSAFYTSLGGIGVAILYGPLHNHIVNKFKARVQELAALMEEIFPRRTVEEWLQKNYAESREQTLALKNIGTDVAEAIYAGFDDHFGDTVGRAMSEHAGSQMEQFAKALDNFSTVASQTMSKYQQINEEYSGAMAQSHDKMLELLKETENILARLNNSTSTIAASAEPLHQSIAALKNFLERTEQATKQLHDEISAQLSRLTDANRQSTANIDNLLTGLREYERNIEQAWQNYEGNFNRVGGELEKATDIVTDRLQKYNEMMNNSMMKNLNDFDKSVSGAIGLLQSMVEDLQDAADDLQKQRRSD